MNIYYIDYENVSSQGLKGVEALTENDEVNLLYSKKADNVKIDILTMMMASKAKIRFLPVHVGTPNALDFQLVTLLFLNYREGDHFYIISKDSGYDCCIKTAAENGAPNVERFPNIESALNGTPAKKTRKGKRSTKDTDPAISPQQGVSSAPAQNMTQGNNSSPAPVQSDAAVSTPESAAPAAVSENASAASEEPAKKKPSRRRSRKKASQADSEDSQNLQSPGDNSPTKGNELKKAQEQEKVQEHVLQQRYLSKQFESKAPQGSSFGSKNDSEKPVSILSIIRRRNDVQLDMHQIDLIREALKSSGNKQQFYSFFVKKLGQKQGIELYHSVKSSYTDLVNANLL